MAETFVFHKVAKDYDKKEKVLNRVLWVAIIVLFSLALLKLAHQFLAVPALKTGNVIVETELSLTKEEIFAIAGMEKNKYYSDQELKKIRKNLEAIPQVSKVLMEKVYPDTLKLVLVSHKPVALSLASVNSKNLPVAFDEKGNVILAGKAMADWNLPIISGLKFNSLETGTKLPRQLMTLLKEITELKTGFPNLYELISEIKVEPVGTVDFELLLYLVAYRIPVRLGRRLSGEQLSYAVMVLDIISKEKADKRIKELDFRTNEVVYKEEGAGN